jgi:hypothetical protein
MALPVPPVAVEYHFKLVPEAVSEDAVALRQIFKGDETVGAAGTLFTLTFIAERVPSQPPDDAAND